MSALDCAIFGRTAACERLAALADDLVPPDQRPALALELFRFLAVKRQLLAAPVPLGLDVSPGGVVDELWHLMLLQTDMRDAVHAALGGDVPHSLADARLPDEDRVRRRLTALNLMQLEGPAPHLPFLQVAGTAMDSIVPISRGGVTVYVCPAMAAADAAAVTDAFVAAVGLPRDEALAAMAAAAGVQPLAGPMQSQQRRFRRARRQQEQEQHEAEEVLQEQEQHGGQEGEGAAGLEQVFVKKYGSGGILAFHVDMATETVEGLKLKIQGRQGILVGQQRLMFAGRELREAGLMQGSTVYLLLNLRVLSSQMRMRRRLWSRWLHGPGVRSCRCRPCLVVG